MFQNPESSDALFIGLKPYLLNQKLLDTQIKVLVIVLVEHRVDKGVDLSLVLPVVGC